MGDGDCAAYPSVVESKPYGPDFVIDKLECVGHVQKRWQHLKLEKGIKTWRRKNNRKTWSTYWGCHKKYSYITDWLTEETHPVYII